MACESSWLSPSKLTVTRSPAASVAAAQERAPRVPLEAPLVATPLRATVQRRLVIKRECEAENFAVRGRTS